MRNLNTTTTPTKSLKKNRTSDAVSEKNGATCAPTYSDEYYTKYVIAQLLAYIATLWQWNLESRMNSIAT